MGEDEFEVVRGSGNVFRDFDDPHAELKQGKAILAAQIIAVMDGRKLTVRKAACQDRLCGGGLFPNAQRRPGTLHTGQVVQDARRPGQGHQGHGPCRFMAGRTGTRIDPDRIALRFHVAPYLLVPADGRPWPVVLGALPVRPCPSLPGRQRAHRPVPGERDAGCGWLLWTVIPVERRDEYMAALEDASVRQEIGPFVDFLGGLVDGRPVRLTDTAGESERDRYGSSRCWRLNSLAMNGA